VPETWNIRAVKYIPDRYLTLLVTPTIPCRSAAELGATSSAAASGPASPVSAS
jgi:hypothetical protein